MKFGIERKGILLGSSKQNIIINENRILEISFLKIISIIALIDFFTLIPDFEAFWGEDSIIPYELGIINSFSFTYLEWIHHYFFGIKLTYLFYAIGCLYVGFLLIQIFYTRLLLSFPIIVFQLILYRSIVHFNYGYDHFITMSFFYSFGIGVFQMFKEHSKAKKVIKTSPLSIILRSHLCIVYFFGGIAKAAGMGWWNGNSLYRAVASFNSNLIFSPIVFALLGIGTVILETFYPVLIFTKFRKWTVLSVICMHLGIGIIMKLPLFALIMITWNVFAHPDLFFPFYKKHFILRTFNIKNKLIKNPGTI